MTATPKTTTSLQNRFGLPRPRRVSDYFGLGHQYIWLPDNEVMRTPSPKIPHRSNWPFLAYIQNRMHHQWTAALSDLQPWLSSLKTLLVVGTGGSSLGGQVLYEAGRGDTPSFSGEFSSSPRVLFIDNIDPGHLCQTLNALDIPTNAPTIGVLVISKSGTTPETLAQLSILLQTWENPGLTKDPLNPQARIAENFVILTAPSPSPLRGVAQAYGCKVIDHDPDLGGRFSCLSPVGLVPGFLGGLDVPAFQEGVDRVALALEKDTSDPRTHRRPPDSAMCCEHFVSLHHHRHKAGSLAAAVTMVYGDAWRHVPPWYVQLWAESLGKRDTKGKSWGTIPMGARGTQDQHSMLQLFLEGPNDKIFTIVLADNYGSSKRTSDDLRRVMSNGNRDLGHVYAGQQADIGKNTPPERAGVRPDCYHGHDLAYLMGASLQELFIAEAWATIRTLIEADRPVRVIHLNRLDARSLGAFLTATMVETALQADLWGINAFDQPAVEYGKRLTKSFLRTLTSQTSDNQVCS